eukprot:GFUD01001431.1.p1 GENE.GFUD01001431.1~~GFUD01001431.1.p1  ORF type:complete len:282 (-),score=53.86 GFUD01001431.1:23-868(-)
MSVQDTAEYTRSSPLDPVCSVLVFTAPAGGLVEGGVSIESLMQERYGDATVTVDEEDDNSSLDQHTNHMQGPLPNHANLVPALPNQSAGLPMPSPLQLVYLQPTPHGVNIIPVQAAGYPAFTPYSPLGFSGHPHHPVVVQSGHPYSPSPHHTTFYKTQPFYSPGPYPTYPHPLHTTNPTPTYHPQPVPMPDVHPQYTRPMVSREPYRSQQKFFRPWEDTDSLDSGGTAWTACCSHKDCGGTGDHHSQSGSHQEQVRQDLVSFSEADFPALSSDLYKLKIEK